MVEIEDGSDHEMMVHVSRVNKIIREAFGWGYAGNYHYLQGATFMDDPDLVPVNDSLGIIAHKLGFDLGLFDFEMGLLNDDGSRIIVPRKYLRQAEKYAELYEDEFGKDVIIKLRQ